MDSFQKNKLNKIMVTATIELALVKISKECLQKVTEILKTDYNCDIADCYENPEYLAQILKDLYGDSSKVGTDFIKEALEEYEDVEKISNFLKVVCKT